MCVLFILSIHTYRQRRPHYRLKLQRNYRLPQIHPVAVHVPCTNAPHRRTHGTVRAPVTHPACNRTVPRPTPLASKSALAKTLTTMRAQCTHLVVPIHQSQVSRIHPGISARCPTPNFIPHSHARRHPHCKKASMRAVDTLY